MDLKGYLEQHSMETMTLLGDEAVAIGAIHGGLSRAYSYPGTPATEILEFLMSYERKHGGPKASWSANEKTAYEEALGMSYAGKRALVSMKHVGLNVAADPFINSSVVQLNGGLVVAVADDPGMHSSQDEQDSRFYADFAKAICLEPCDQQEAYEMTKDAFTLSERFKIPVMIRLVTRIAHSRAIVKVAGNNTENQVQKSSDRGSWILIPANAKKLWKKRLNQEKEIVSELANSKYNSLYLNVDNKEFGVITTGLAKNYYLENLPDLSVKPSHLHLGAYPISNEQVLKLFKHVQKVLVIEEGYPFVEKRFRGIEAGRVEIQGKETGHVKRDGELTPEIVRAALGLTERKKLAAVEEAEKIPARPPQLCAGCPHIDTFDALKKALTNYPNSVVTSDIGCYTLGALPPYNAIESCVCMGASVGMAKGAADAGLTPAVAVIGDSTFIHSGISPLIDAINSDTNMTLIILDNQAVAMTGGQTTIMSSARLQSTLLGLGVDKDHFHVLNAHRNATEKNTEIIKSELDHKGLSVIVAVRECLETAKKKKKTTH